MTEDLGEKIAREMRESGMPLVQRLRAIPTIREGTGLCNEAADLIEAQVGKIDMWRDKAVALAKEVNALTDRIAKLELALAREKNRASDLEIALEYRNAP